MSTADEVRTADEVPLWVIPQWRERFGVVAGITGRADRRGRPFDLRLEPGAMAGNTDTWRRFRASFPAMHRFAIARQQHGTRVLWLTPGDGEPTHRLTVAGDADGLATAQAECLLLVTVADCIPVYLLDPATRALALLHAGWRGVAGGVLSTGVRALKTNLGCNPGNLVMHLGTGISHCCFEVGSEVLTALDLPQEGPGPWSADLREVLAHQAGDLGIREVSISARCTACARSECYSHRASRGADGRMVAYLGSTVG